MKDKKTNFGSMKRLISFIIKNYKLEIILVFIGIIASSIATVIGTNFLRTLIDDYIEPMLKSSNPDFTPLATAIMHIFIIYILGTFFAYLYNRIMINVSQGTMRSLRQNLFAHMEKLPIRYFDSTAHGDTMSVYTNDIDTLRQLIGQSLPQLAGGIITIVSVFISMIMLDFWLSIISLLMTLFLFFVSGKVAKSSSRYFIQQQASLGKVNGYIEEMMNGQKVIKVFTHEEKVIEEFEVLNEELRTSAYKANAYANILMPVVFQLGNISYVICALIGASLSVGGIFSLTVGELVAFLALVKNFYQPFTQMSQQLNAVVMASAGADRLYRLLDEKVEVDDGKISLVKINENKSGDISETDKNTGLWAWKEVLQDGTAKYTKLEGDIVLEHVDFSYVPEKPVLHNISVFANKGQKLAFVGSTGAGKTTITNLINRFYDISAGSIKYDGINIDDIKKSDLRRSLGIVLQDTRLFTGTIMENIRYGRMDATDEECIAAAKLANAHGFIDRLPDAYDTVISGDGGALSQGQRQLIAIARAAVADPPVLILDEATSSIDTRTEQLVQKGMDSLMKGRTTFVIAHRLSTIKNADCIMVLEQGKIIERGNHEELLLAKGRYHQLYTGNQISA